MGTSHHGCYLMFRWNEELAEAYYFEHYNNITTLMRLCL